MKGIFFNLLEEFITENYGEEKYDEILGECRLSTTEPFVGPGTYPDEDLLAIATKTAEKLGITVPDALRAFGRFCFPKLAARYPVFVAEHHHPKSFLETVDSVIHVEVRKLYEGTKLPRFTYSDGFPDHLVIRYQSDRKMCQLMEGLIDGVADYYKSPIKQSQTQCMLRGAESCDFDLTFEPTAK